MLTDSFAPHLFAIMLVNNRRAPGGKGFNLSVSSTFFEQHSVRNLLRRCIMLAWEASTGPTAASTSVHRRMGRPRSFGQADVTIPAVPMCPGWFCISTVGLIGRAKPISL